MLVVFSRYGISPQGGLRVSQNRLVYFKTFAEIDRVLPHEHHSFH